MVFQWISWILALEIGTKNNIFYTPASSPTSSPWFFPWEAGRGIAPPVFQKQRPGDKVAVADPGEGPATPLPPLIFRNEARRAEKCFCEDAPPSMSGPGWSPPPPPLPYLKVWIHHWVVFVRTPPALSMSGPGWSHTHTQNYKNFTLSQLKRLGVNKTS